MSGQRRLFRKGTRKLSSNFGLIAMVLLAALAIIVTLKFPGMQLLFLAGP
jgi:hypothetical protein